MNRYLILLFLCLTVFSRLSLAWSILTDDLDVSCQQDVKSLNCKYRILAPGPAPAISVKSNGTELQVTELSQHSENNKVTAILFLVDTSDPNRQNVIEKNKSHIKELLTVLKPRHKTGLASFDKSIQIKSPLGTSTFLLSKSIDTLRAAGKTTELYRNLLKAIDYLKSFDAQRRAIILLSDGQAEDKAYFHSDVIKAARKSGVIINSIGYPRSISLSVALQTLRRISEETGGNYIETDMTYNLPTSYLKQLTNNLDSGGKFSVKLDELYKDNPPDSLKLAFQTKGGTKSIKVPVTIKVARKPVQQKYSVPIVSVEKTRQSIPVNKPQIQIVTKQADNQAINLWLWYGLPAAFIIIIVFILITLFLLWNRNPVSKDSSTNSDYKPYAYLIAEDGKETRYPITRTIWRIGRSKNNELSLNETSLSRRHAEIHRNSDGTFDIIDMNSMNGVYINNEKIGKAELHEGDIVEIGDIFLRFSQLAADYSLEESTVMQKTKVPSTH